jgi:hypothetical protein
MKAFIVREPFTRSRVFHAKGTIIVERDKVAALEGSAHEAHLIPTHLPDDHELVARERERLAPPAPAPEPAPAVEPEANAVRAS